MNRDRNEVLNETRMKRRGMGRRFMSSNYRILRAFLILSPRRREGKSENVKLGGRGKKTSASMSLTIGYSREERDGKMSV